MKGDPFETLKKFVKNRTVLKKIERGDPLVLSCFVGRKVKMKGGPLALSWHWPDLALVVFGFRSFSKK